MLKTCSRTISELTDPFLIKKLWSLAIQDSYVCMFWRCLGMGDVVIFLDVLVETFP